MSDEIALVPDEDTDTLVMTQAEVDDAMTVVNDTLAAAASRRRPEVSDVIAALLGKLEGSYLDADSRDIEFHCDGRDYQLVWDDAGATSIDATLWDETDAEPVQLAKLRFIARVISPPITPYAADDDEPHIVRSAN